MKANEHEQQAEQAEQADESRELTEFEKVKTRLTEISEAVENEDLTLDEALDLYEEAVALGLQASDLLEADIPLDEEQPSTAEAAPSEADGA